MNITNKKTMMANVLKKLAETSMSTSANSRCMFIYHQPKHPEQLKKLRKF